MVRFIDADTRVIVQGITGTQGSFHTGLMLDYGTRVVAGVVPGRAGKEVEGVPVYDTVVDAMAEHEADASIVFVPARSAVFAAKEAVSAGLDPVVVITEHIPIRDSMELVALARQHARADQVWGVKDGHHAGPGLQGGLHRRRL